MPAPGRWSLAAQAGNHASLFEQLAQRLFEGLLPLEGVGPALREKIIVQDEDWNGLLRSWAGALLRLPQDQRMVFRQFQVRIDPAADGLRLRADAVGELIDPHRHAFQRQPSGWQCVQAFVIEKDGTIEGRIELEENRLDQRRE